MHTGRTQSRNWLRPAWIARGEIVQIQARVVYQEVDEELAVSRPELIKAERASLRLIVMSASDSISTVVVVAFVGCIFGWEWWRSRVRTREIRSLAESCGFHFLGDALPRSVPLRGSDLDLITEVQNVIDGEPRGKRIVAFDCRFGVGKRSWRRTVIAINADAGNRIGPSFDPTFRVEQMNDWTFIYRPKSFSFIRVQLTPISELRGYLETI